LAVAIVALAASLLTLAATWRPEVACVRTHNAIVEVTTIALLAERLNYVETQCGVIVLVQARADGTVILAYRVPIVE
jgi:hypothetical protein